MRYSAMTSNIIILILFMITSLNAQSGKGFSHFITASGDRLMDGNKEFRFISFNTPNLLMIEDNMQFCNAHPWRLPDAYEIEDALKTIKIMGGEVTRTYVITVRRKDDLPEIQKHVTGPGAFNETAFKNLDLILAKANEIGVRLIIPFMDNWKWMGGRPQYASFRGKDKNDFWTDKELKIDFKKTLSYVLNRKNTITGIAYKDDKAIMAWELGNELKDVPESWYTEMAKYIKQIDKNHLINEGIQNGGISDEVLDNPYIDVLSTHHYERNPLDMISNIAKASKRARGKKPYYIGEFGFLSKAGLEKVVDLIIETGNISGGLLWSLRFHNRDGGFYWHSEPLGDGLYKAYHWPGFASGTEYGETEVMAMMYEKAYEIQNKPLSELIVPEAPVLMRVSASGVLDWKGAVGAEQYIVERSNSQAGPWRVVGQGMTDTDVAYASIFNDETVQPGDAYFYKVKAENTAGISSFSNIIGPVKIENLTFIDNLESFSKIFYQKGNLKILYTDARKCNEDFNRLIGEKGSEIIYSIPGELLDCKIFSYTREKNNPFKVLVSVNGKEYSRIDIKSENYYSGGFDYGYYYPILVKSINIPEKSRYVKIVFLTDAQIGRIEFNHGK